MYKQIQKVIKVYISYSIYLQHITDKLWENRQKIN